MKNKIIRKITYCAILIALNVLFSRILALNTSVMKIGLGFIAIAIGSAMFGPIYGAIIAAMGDFLGAILFPTGAYFPFFTLSAALSGIIYGLFLKKYSKIRAIEAAMFDTTLVTLFINTYLISIITGNTYKTMLITRLPQYIIMSCVEVLVFILLLPKIIKLIDKFY